MKNYAFALLLLFTSINLFGGTSHTLPKSQPKAREPQRVIHIRNVRVNNYFPFSKEAAVVAERYCLSKMSVLALVYPSMQAHFNTCLNSNQPEALAPEIKESARRLNLLTPEGKFRSELIIWHLITSHIQTTVAPCEHCHA